jgi:hypothetical protein
LRLVSEKDDARIKGIEGMKNSIALTQWLYSGEGEHDLAGVMVA